ncbi:MAG: phosphoribosylanthranilate isomerase [Longimicrobiales bacterium]|nr:phosphoribosylanthranilate isomerase [Longimicrobiales bacterium]
MTRFKVCCIRDEVEVKAAVGAGASAVGFVSAMPSGPGPIPEDVIARLLPAVPPGVSSFLLTSLTAPDALAEQHRRLPTDTVQLVDRLPSGSYREARRLLPGVRLVQVVHVEGPEAVDAVRRVAGHVDAILLDSGRPGAEVPELGGTGRAHDWSVSRRVVEAVDVPVWLAGGLSGDNVAEAVATVRPFGVDVCSGVRTDGRLDTGKLDAFAGGIGRARNGTADG